MRHPFELDPVEQAEDGRSYLLLRATAAEGTSTELWVDKSDYAVRKIIGILGGIGYELRMSEVTFGSTEIDLSQFD